MIVNVVMTHDTEAHKTRCGLTDIQGRTQSRWKDRIFGVGGFIGGVDPFELNLVLIQDEGRGSCPGPGGLPSTQLHVWLPVELVLWLLTMRLLTVAGWILRCFICSYSAKRLRTGQHFTTTWRKLWIVKSFWFHSENTAQEEAGPEDSSSN